MANKTWLRLYTEITRDRKIRRLKAEHRWIWIAILCMAKESPIPGKLFISEKIPASIADIADEAAATEEEVKEAIEIFKEQYMVNEEEGVLAITNWDKRQFASDNSTDRVRRHRLKQHRNVTETLQKRCGNASETPPDTDTDTETDKDLYLGAALKKDTAIVLSYRGRRNGEAKQPQPQPQFTENINNQSTNHLETCENQEIPGSCVKRKENAENSDNGDCQLGSIPLAFEKELGRPLSPIEADLVSQMAQEFPSELVHEALRRAVAAGKRNMRYIEGILRSWKDNGLNSYAEVIHYENFRKIAKARDPTAARDYSEYSDW